MWKSNVKSTLEESRGMNSSETEAKYVIEMHILQNPNLTCSVPGGRRKDKLPDVRMMVCSMQLKTSKVWI